MNTTADTNTASLGTGKLADRRVMLAFGGLLVAMFIGALDQTIMATALPTIAGQLGGLSELSWVVTAYVLAVAASTPVWGKASDLFGRRRLIAAAIVVFIGFSALSGTAQTIGSLVAFRALQYSCSVPRQTCSTRLPGFGSGVARDYGARLIAGPPGTRRKHMTDKHVDEGKGRVKEAAGSLTGDQSLKNEGKVDKAKSSVKDTVDKVGDKLTGKD